MPTLAERIDKKSQELSQQIPDEVLQTMEDATKQIEATGVKEEALKEGDSMPSFELPDADGNIVSSDDLLEEGPLALHFYRGVW
mgnify:CR=1 FL=1